MRNRRDRRRENEAIKAISTITEYLAKLNQELTTSAKHKEMTESRLARVGGELNRQKELNKKLRLQLDKLKEQLSDVIDKHYWNSVAEVRQALTPLEKIRDSSNKEPADIN